MPSPKQLRDCRKKIHYNSIPDAQQAKEKFWKHYKTRLQFYTCPCKGGFCLTKLAKE